MTSRMRLISFLTMFLSVVSASIALFVLNDKNLARILFVLIIVVGYSAVFVLWRREKGKEG